MNIIVISIFIWSLCGIVCVCLDLLATGRISVGAVVVQIFFGPLALIAFLAYLGILIFKEAWTGATDDLKNNVRAILLFTIIAATSLLVFYLWLR